ncbi:hypothetical protein CTEN210_09138 [Chaetoceros tenuissimus]|uniref:Ankyrin repeat-containing protein n=1 Tax=Chaetoceros tenuissimus TaxID=426638 RepID=A0AAD3CUV4_9STRA|nr:hypothetical protein CTEN210_09138 [Chaetoceros tenuissimus]
MASVFPYHIADGTALNYDTFVQLAEIVANGHLEVIDFLHDEGIILDFYVLLKMFDRCKATSLHSMVSKGIFTEYRHCVFNCLITDGEIDILKESYKAFLSDMDECTFRCCAEGGNIEVMNWLLQQHECEWTLGLFRCAAKSGNIQMMELCLRNGCPTGEILYASALENKNKETALDTLIWLHEHNIPWHECVCQFAAKHGNLKALRWARENGCPWNEDTFNYAAQYGTIEILDYCFENNCPVDHNDIYHFPFFDRELKPTESDLQERSLKVYKWLFQHSIPWSDEAGMLAAHEGHLATLMWAVENGCPWHDDILGYAIGSYDISIVKYCVEHLSSIDETVYVLAIEKMNKTHERRVSDVTDIQMIKMLQIFRDYGVPWSRDIISNAERIGRSNVANWLRCVGCPE